MWPWQRMRQADRPTGHPAEGPAAPAAPVAARRAEWSTLPPIQRSVGAMRPVAPQQEFGDSLVSWRNPSLLAPLGHLVSADAPAGVIHRLIEPAAPTLSAPVHAELTFANPARRRAPSGNIIQRMLAAASSRAGQEPEPPNMEPYRSETELVTPPPSADPVTLPAPQLAQAAPVQRSVPGAVSPGAVSMTRAPSPAMPVLELPVIATPPAMTETPGEAQPEAADAPPQVESSPVAEVDETPTLEVDEVPTLGVGGSSAAPLAPVSRSAPLAGVQGGGGGSAGVSGPVPRAGAGVVEAGVVAAGVVEGSGGSVVEPVVARVVGAGPGSAVGSSVSSPSSAGSSSAGVGVVPTLGVGGSSVAPSVGVGGGGGSAGVSGPVPRAGAGVVEAGVVEAGVVEGS
ncbi:MAG: hypothetical protein ACRDSP_26710, partial [Pseudonocardiaceae bacterium]